MKIQNDILCPKCGSATVKRNSARGAFYGCTTYPKCNGIARTGQKATMPPVRPTMEQMQEAAKSVVGTPQQELIWDAIVKGTGHMIVQARAGCGKTFTITHALSLLPNTLKIGFSAFNKHSAEDLKKKVPAHIEAFTLHSMGYKAIRANLGSVRVDEDKISGILDELIGDTGAREVATRTAVTKLVSLCKNTLTDASDHGALDALADRYDVTIDSDGGLQPSAYKADKKINMNVSRERVFDLVEKALNISNARLKTIDMDDMIYVPVFHNMAIEQYDILFGDEAQDFNLCQQQLVLRACKTGRLILVGDDRQSIYGFRGADPKSMGRMLDILNGTARKCVQLPLTYTRRCPKSHVVYAQQIVPDIEAMPEAIEGFVQRVGEHKAQAMMKAGNMVICRTNAPLIQTAYQLIQRGIPAIVRGRDIGAGLQALIRTLKASDLSELTEKLEAYVAKEKTRLMASNKAGSAIAALEDKAATLNALMEGAADLSELRARIDEMFSDTDRLDDKVLLSSVHRAKGLEADVVFILKPELMPHPMASNADDYIQEMNIAYVACTRAKKTLVFAGDSSPAFDGGPEDSDEVDIEEMTQEQLTAARREALGTQDVVVLPLNENPVPQPMDEVELNFCPIIGSDEAFSKIADINKETIESILNFDHKEIETMNLPSKEQQNSRNEKSAETYARTNIANWIEAKVFAVSIEQDGSISTHDSETAKTTGKMYPVQIPLGNGTKQLIVNSKLYLALKAHYLSKHAVNFGGN